MKTIWYKNNMTTFDDYLRGLHAQQYEGYDDNMSDDFEKWLEKFDVAEILDLVASYESDKNFAAKILGKLGGQGKSEAKAKAARINGKLGGKPKKVDSLHTREEER